MSKMQMSYVSLFGKIEKTLAHQIEHRSEVASGSPANVTHWIVNTPVLVRPLISARAVGSSDPNRDLLFVQRSAIKLHANHAYDDYLAPIAHEVDGTADWCG